MNPCALFKSCTRIGAASAWKLSIGRALKVLWPRKHVESHHTREGRHTAIPRLLEPTTLRVAVLTGSANAEEKEKRKERVTQTRVRRMLLSARGAAAALLVQTNWHCVTGRLDLAPSVNGVFPYGVPAGARST